MEWNASQFLAGLKAANALTSKVAARAVDVFSEHVIGDAQQLAPVKTGALQGSGTVGATAAQVAAQSPVQVTDRMIEKQIGFNTNYAAAVHENLTAHHDHGQSKFLEAAIQANAPKMLPFVAQIIKAEVGE